MDCELLAWSKARGEEVGVEVAEKKRGLKEDETGDPDRGRSAEDGQELLGGKRFDQKKQG